MKRCPECNGTGQIYKVKLSNGQTVYMAGSNTFDKDTGGGHKGSITITCRFCRGTGRVEKS